MTFEIQEEAPASIKVIGVGGGGGNAVRHMIAKTTSVDIEFINANTDHQAMLATPAHSLPLGLITTRGLGAGANPDVGYEAAKESREAIKERLLGADMLFITAGMGGGTGTGGAPYIAQVAREMGILTVGIVTRPFSFEGPRRQKIADQGIAALQEHVDSLITIPNDKLLSVLGKQATLMAAFAAVNDVLHYAVHGIAEMITTPGFINVDFADVSTVMRNHGHAKIGTGIASGEDRAQQAAFQAINSPLLDDISIEGAQGILVNIKAGPGLSIGEFNMVGETVGQFASGSATVVIGTTLDMNETDDIQVTVVATGLMQNDDALAKQGASQSAASEVKNSVIPPPPVGIPKAPPPIGAYTALQAKETARKDQQKSARPVSDTDIEYLDIPAFLRRNT